MDPVEENKILDQINESEIQRQGSFHELNMQAKNLDYHRSPFADEPIEQQNQAQTKQIIPKAVNENYNKLSGFVEEINVKINNILKQSEEDFLYAYKDQMSNIQRELKILKRKMDEETLKQKADDKMNILEEERDYFRAEALRLDKICKEQQRDLEELKFKQQILLEDKNYYEGFVIDTKKENKALKSELLYLYKNKLEGIGKINELQKRQQDLIDGIEPLSQSPLPEQEEERLLTPSQISMPRVESMHRDSNQQQNFFPTQISQPMKRAVTHQQKHRGQVDNDIISMEIKNLKDNEMTYVQTIKNLKQYLEKEKQVNRKLKGEITQLNQLRSDLEQILLDCIGEAKKDIQKRRTLQQSKDSLKSLKSPQNFQPYGDDEEIDYAKFSHIDKVQVLKKFISSEKFLEQIYQITFGKRASTANTQSRPSTTALNTPQTNFRLTESWKQDFNDANQVYNQFKGFRYTFSAKQFAKINITKKDLNSAHFKFSSQTMEKIKNIKQI